MRSNCPISYSLELFGDKWSLLILRDALFSNKKTFKEFSESEEGIATNILTSRLNKLVDEGFLTKEKSLENKRISLFLPTERAKSLIPIFCQLTRWGISDNPKLETKELMTLLKQYEEQN